MAVDKEVRYDPSPLLGSGSPLNIVVGARRMGKTYAFVRHGIRRFLKTGEQFVYLRRFERELKDTIGGSKTSFFYPFLANNEFEDVRLRVNGRLMECKQEGGRWQTMGLLMSLSKAQNYKGANSEGVTGSIIFDEFIKEKKIPPYLPNEVDALVGLWSTLDGYNDTARVFMLANAADLVNPYFAAWKLPLPKLGEILTVPHGASSITIQYADSAAFKEQAKQTNIGRFVEGSSYADYAIENQFAQASGVFVASKTSSAKFAYSLVFGGVAYGVWTDAKLGDVFVSSTIPKDNELSFTLLRQDMRPNMMQIERASPLLRMLKNTWLNGGLYFETDAMREKFMESLQIIGIR